MTAKTEQAEFAECDRLLEIAVRECTTYGDYMHELGLIARHRLHTKDEFTYMTQQALEPLAFTKAKEEQKQD